MSSRLVKLAHPQAARAPSPRSAAAARPWLNGLARTGLIARGVIYLLLAYLAVEIALNGRSAPRASSQGALQEVARQREGLVLLGVLAFGLGAYGLWRLSVAIFGGLAPRHHGVPARLGALATAIVYFSLCTQAVVIVIGGSRTGASSTNPTPFAARVLSWPHGAQLLEVAGGLIIAAGIALAVRGLFRNYAKDLETKQMTESRYRLIKVLGGIGELTRGGLVALIGWYVFEAGRVSDPSRVKGTDATLRSISQHTYGTVMLVAVALGLACFGLYSFLDARFRSL